MKTTLLILAVVALVAAAPKKPTRLHYRNLFKTPIKEIKTNPALTIIGGQEAEPHSIPSQAFLEVYAGFEGWYCSGTLISENYVLTAGQCGYGGTEAHITLGAHKPLEHEDTQVIVVSKEIKVHEDFVSATVTNDIAVIKLPESVNLTSAIQTVALPSRADAQNTYEGVTARMSGWGSTFGFINKLSDVLRYVDVPVISNEECSESFDGIIDSNLCTSGKGIAGSCNGDSGGPLIVDGVQIGIVSFGDTFCLPGFSSGFSRVTSFLDWLGQNTDVIIN